MFLIKSSLKHSISILYKMLKTTASNFYLLQTHLLPFFLISMTALAIWIVFSIAENPMGFCLLHIFNHSICQWTVFSCFNLFNHFTVFFSFFVWSFFSSTSITIIFFTFIAQKNYKLYLLLFRQFYSRIHQWCLPV